jgi:hypothetical protein
MLVFLVLVSGDRHHKVLVRLVGSNGISNAPGAWVELVARRVVYRLGPAHAGAGWTERGSSENL